MSELGSIIGQVVGLALAGGLFAVGCGAAYWGGQISSGIRQLQGITRDHEERLRDGGL